MRFEFGVRPGAGDVVVRTSVRARLDEVHTALTTRPGGSRRSPGDSDTRTESVGGWVLEVVGGPDAGVATRLRPEATIIGRDPCCDLVLTGERVSRRHARLLVAPHRVTIQDAGSIHGTCVDGVQVPRTGVALDPDDVAVVGDAVLAVRDLALPSAMVTRGPGGDVVHRGARSDRPSEPVVVRWPDAPAQPAHPAAGHVLTGLLACAGAGALAWFTHSMVFLLLGVISPVVGLGAAMVSRVRGAQAHRRSSSAFRTRCRALCDEIDGALRAEAATRRRREPDPCLVSRIAGGPSDRLWERRPDDDDFLRLRVGLATLPSHLTVADADGRRPAGQVAAVPCSVDATAGHVGVVGPLATRSGLLRWLALQVAVLHSPAEVALAVFADRSVAAGWAWANQLPHIVDRVAVDLAQWTALTAELRRSLDGADAVPGVCRTVVVIDGPVGQAHAAGLTALATGPPGPVTLLWSARSPVELPAAVRTTILPTDRTGTVVSVLGSHHRTDEVLADRVGTALTGTVGRALTGLQDAGAANRSAPPAHCELLDLLGLAEPTVAAIERHWAASDERAGGVGSADTVLGSTCDGPMRIDLVADGPHALVAGTTGAGKSELLRCLVAGLALNHPPDRLTLLLVDYKGGAAFGECRALPHVTGLLTDLDPQLTRRALASLDAELRRREAVLAAAGVADLDGLSTHRGVASLARLVIVVDEFAALAEELPDFVTGLVRVAARGRSLGLHLVLATQRPGTAVTPDIRANTALRVGLRMLDAGESRDVLDAPHATTITRATPGRAYVRTSDGLRLVQTALVASNARPLSALTDLVGQAARRRGSGRSDTAPPWLPALPNELSVGPLSAPEASGGAGLPFALLDLPDRQAQPVLAIEPDEGAGWLVVGGPRSGRTTALRTIVAQALDRRSAESLEIYVIDGDGRLHADTVGIARVVTSLGPEDPDAVATLLQRLAGRSTAGGPQRPALLVVDDWDRLTGLEGADPGLADLLDDLLRNAGTARLTVVVTGDRTLLAPRVAGAFQQRLLLRMPDAADYLLAGVGSGSVPVNPPPGRAVRVPDGAELQVAVREFPSDDASAADPNRTDHSGPGFLDPARGSNGTCAVPGIRVRALPRAVTLRDLPRPPHALTIGVAGDDAAPVAIDRDAEGLRWVIAGPPRSGRSTALAALLSEARRVGWPVLVAAPTRSPLHRHARGLGVPTVDGTSPVAAVTDHPVGTRLLLVDDVETFADTPLGDRLCAWARADTYPLSVVVSGRPDELAVAYRGLAAEVRRSRCGLLLCGGPLDGEIFGVRRTRNPAASAIAGRGVLVGASALLRRPPARDGRPDASNPAGGVGFDGGGHVLPVQIALP